MFQFVVDILLYPEWMHNHRMVPIQVLGLAPTECGSHVIGYFMLKGKRHVTP